MDRVIDVYFSMLTLELAGEPYSKTAFRRELLADIGRSNGSAEYKFQNVSAVLAELGAVFIDGYKPARNTQQLLRERVAERFGEAASLRQNMLRAVESPAEDRAVVLGRPSPVPEIPESGEAHHRSRARRGRQVNYQEIEARNRTLGLAGERAVVALEKRRLVEADRVDLAQKVRHMSVEEGDGLGYDVLSFGVDGAERFLEVKTTRYSPFQPFMVSRNEVEVSEEEPDRFALVRLFRFETPAVGYYELAGPLTSTAYLRPDTYLGLPRSGIA